MKAKALDIDMDDSLPKFVERTMEVPVEEETTLNPEFNDTEPILKNLETPKTEEPKRDNQEEITVKEEVVEEENEEQNNQEENEEQENQEEDNSKPLELPLFKEEDQNCTNLNNKPEKEGSDWKNKAIEQTRKNMKLFMEYFIGFLIGVSMSLLGYKFVKFVNKKRRTRRGLFIGCLVSFVLIFFLCIFYMTYTREVLLTERTWRKHHRTLKRLRMPGFSLYLKYSVTNMTKGLFSAVSSLVPKLSFSHRRRRHSSAKTRRKIKALRRMRSKIHRHLRVLL